MGAPHIAIVIGAVCVAAWLWFSLELPKLGVLMRPIYQEIGLLPARDRDLARDEHEPARDSLREAGRKENPQ
jgi:hypothetical protein